MLEKILPMSVSKYFIKRNFNGDIVSEIKKMTENIKESMLQRMQNVEWLDEETKNYAIQKVLKMKNRIIYPDNFRDVTKLYHKSEELNINNYLDLFIAGETSIPSNDNEMTKSGEWRSTAFVKIVYIYCLIIVQK